MERRALPLKRALRGVLLVLLLGAVGMTKLQAQNITFADARVKSLCVTNWDTNHDGELSYAEAAAVTSLGTVFKSKSNITTFDELQYFVGLTSIDNSAFYYCTGLTSIVIPNSVTSIGNQAFYYCRYLTSIIIPNFVTTIGDQAFYYCYGLTSIEIPNSVISIGDQAFRSCYGLEQIIVEAGNTTYDSRDNCNAIINSTTNELIIGCSNTIIPNSVSSIGDYAFYYCSNLTSIEIPNSVTSIGDYAFYYCLGLTSIEIPSSVTSIGDYVFTSCYGLISVELSNSLTSISDYAFSYCSDITSIEIPNSVTSIGSHAFSGCSGLTLIGIPNSVTSIGNHAFSDCSGLASVEIPNSVTFIGNSAFSNCSELTSIEIPNSVTSIGDYAFHYCTSLTSVVIPNSVTSIGEYAFNNCTTLSSIEIPNSVTSIGNCAFYYCMSLTSMTVWVESPMALGNSVFYLVNKSIPVYVPCGSLEAYQNTNGWNEFINMFELCSGEVAVTVNPSEGGMVTGAGYYNEGDICVLTADPNPGFAFGNWTENGMVVSTDPVFSFHAHPTTIVANFYSSSPIVFADANVKALCVANWDTNGDGELSYAEAAAVTSLGEVFQNNSTILSFDELQYFISLTFIGNNAFSSCTGLKSVRIPEFVTNIGQSAFSSCTSLTSIEIPELVTQIGSNAFSNCYGLQSITVLAENSPWLEGEWVGYMYGPEFGYFSEYVIQVFLNVNKDISVYVPCGSLESYQNTTDWNEFTNMFELCSGEIAVSANPSEGGVVTGAGYYNEGDICLLTATSNLGYGFGNWMENGVVVSTDSVFSFHAHPTNIVANFCSNNPIVFADANVKALCVANWDTNGDGELSYAEAAAVTSLGEVFRSNSTIVSFDELQYFVGLTFIGGSAFYNCTSLTSVKIPECVTAIGGGAFSYCTSLTSIEIPSLVTQVGNYAFSNCTGLESITVLADYPPLLERGFVPSYIFGSPILLYETSVFNNVNKSIPVHVPCGSLEAYQQADGWKQFTNIQETGCPVYEITATANPAVGGTVTGGGEYTQGTTCTLTASPKVGYIFLNWTKDDEEVSTEATYSFTVTEDATLVANFEANIITQTTALAKGWNWYSTYIEQEGIDGLGQLENSIGVPNAIIQSQNDGYVKSGMRNGRVVWRGELTSVNNEEMYKIGTKTACTTTMEGIAADPANHPITINRGWNWIGFPCDHSVSVSEAMSGFSPKKNDMIKGRNGSATYSNGTWSGTLNTLEPGQGYMYGSKSNVTKTLVFQTGNRGEATLANITPENNYYQPAEDYADNMTVIAVVELDGEELRSEDYELAAFAGDECRGSVKLMYVEAINRYVAFLTVFGDEADDLHFVLTDGATSDLSAEHMTYATDGIEGTLDEPVVLRFGTTDINENASVNVRVYPNPSKGQFTVEGTGLMRITNMLGQVMMAKEIAERETVALPKGMYFVTLNGNTVKVVVE